MKPISDKQMNAIRKLARATKTVVENVEQMSSMEASEVIDRLLRNLHQLKDGTVYTNGKPQVQGKRDYSSDVLAGLAVKILAQKHDVKTIIDQRQQFKERVKELYEVFSEARQACLA